MTRSPGVGTLSPARTVALAAISVVAVIGAACGKGEDALQPTVPAPGAVPNGDAEDTAGDAIEIVQGDNFFTPSDVRAEGGAVLRVELVNQGGVSHTFTVDAADIDVRVGPGEREAVDVVIPGNRDVAFYCSFHRAQGMEGTIMANGDE